MSDGLDEAQPEKAPSTWRPRLPLMKLETAAGCSLNEGWAAYRGTSGSVDEKIVLGDKVYDLISESALRNKTEYLVAGFIAAPLAMCSIGLIVILKYNTLNTIVLFFICISCTLYLLNIKDRKDEPSISQLFEAAGTAHRDELTMLIEFRNEITSGQIPIYYRAWPFREVRFKNASFLTFEHGFTLFFQPENSRKYVIKKLSGPIFYGHMYLKIDEVGLRLDSIFRKYTIGGGSVYEMTHAEFVIFCRFMRQYTAKPPIAEDGLKIYTWYFDVMQKHSREYTDKESLLNKILNRQEEIENQIKELAEANKMKPPQFDTFTDTQIKGTLSGKYNAWTKCRSEAWGNYAKQFRTCESADPQTTVMVEKVK